ncbi:MAG: glycosyltransferase family 9 protein [Microthrixaceae bacterium]
MASRSISVGGMRRVDFRIGVPLCFVLTLLRKLSQRRVIVSEPHRILIVKLAEQGASVAAHMAFSRAVDLVGRENVFIAVFAENRFIIDELGIVDPANVLTIRTTSLTTLVWDALRVVVSTRLRGIDTVVDFEFFSRVTAIISFLTGAERRVGLHSFDGEGPYRGDLLTHRVNANPAQHVSTTFMSLIEAARAPSDELPTLDAGPWQAVRPPLIAPTDAEMAKVRRLVTDRLGVDELTRLVILNANTGDLVPLRRWPTERYLELAHRLLERYPDVAIILTGAPDEAGDVEHVESMISSPRCVSLAGLTTMRELLVLYEISEVLITNDSGPAHFATMTSVDVIVLFGPETPAVFGPTGPRVHTVWTGIACSPCVNVFNNRQSPCANNVCMQRIDVDWVEALAIGALSARSAQEND